MKDRPALSTNTDENSTCFQQADLYKKAAKQRCDEAYSYRNMVEGQANQWTFWVPDTKQIHACNEAQKKAMEQFEACLKPKK